MATAQYEKHDWTDGETITEENLDHIEQGVAAATDGLRALEEQAFTSIQVETLAAGSPATAVVQDGVLKLGLPQGATGPTGADGADGAQGSPGAAGKQGTSYRISTETFTASKADCQASAVTPASSVLPIIVGDLIEDATKAVWAVTAVSGDTFTVGAAAVRAAPA